MDGRVKFYNRANIDGGGSATAAASSTGFRWTLMGANFGWVNMTSSAAISLIEMDASQSAVIFKFATSATSGFFPCVFGELGCQASVSDSRLILNMATIGGTFTALFSGYYG